MIRVTVGVVVALAAVFIAANAIAWWGTLSAHDLVVRKHDFEWELVLPWRAARGEWVGVHFAYPIGPLFQLLAWVGALGAPSVPERVVAGMHVVFPALSILTGAWVARGMDRRAWPRVVLFALLALLSLHDDVRSLRSMMSLAVIVAFVSLDARARRPWGAGIALLVAGALSLDGLLLGVLSLVAISSAEWLTERTREQARRSAARLGVALAPTALGVLVWAGLASVFGDGPSTLFGGARSVVVAYSVTMASDARELSADALITFGLLALAPWPWLLRRDRVAALWLAGCVPLLLRGALRTDAEHAYAAMFPLVAVLAACAFRHARPEARRPWLLAHAGVLSVLFLLGWLAEDRRPVRAWHPGRLAVAAAVLREGRAPEPYDSDLGRVMAWATEAARDQPACVGFPPGMGVAHVVANVAGPTAATLRWSGAMQREHADAIRAARCPWFVQSIMSFDRPWGLRSWSFGPDLVARSELYRPTERLGPATFVSRLRDTPVPSTLRPLLAHEVPRRLEVRPDQPVTVRFARPVPWDHLVELTYRLDVPRWSQLLGSAPWMTVQFFDGDEPLGEWMVVPGLQLGREVTQPLPVHPEMAEWRWVAERAPPEAQAADRMVLTVRGRALTTGPLTLRVRGLAERAPPPRADPPAMGCEATRLLAGEGLVRHTPHGGALTLETQAFGEPLAEIFVPVRPCSESCLFAEVALTEGERAGFEVHVIDGARRPRLAGWTLGRENARPLEVPLGPWADRDVLIRFGATGMEPLPEDDETVRVIRPRIGPCTSLDSLMQRAYDGELQVVRGEARLSGDQIQLALRPPSAPPADVRIPIRVPPASDDPCLAVDLTVPDDWQGIPFAVDVGVLQGDVVRRLSRPAIWREERLFAVRDLPLGRFAEQEVIVRFAAWPLTRVAWEDTAVIARPRVHRCGDGAPWAFGGRR